MAYQTPRSAREGAGNAFQRVISAIRAPFLFNSDRAQRTTSDGERPRWVQHQGARSSSAGVPGWRNRERSTSARRSGGPPVVIMCETCMFQLPAHLAVSCCGCNKGTHEECQEHLDIGENFSVDLCFMCTRKVEHWMRIVRAAERRNFREWREDSWFRTIVEAASNNSPLGDTGHPVMNQLQYFL